MNRTVLWTPADDAGEFVGHVLDGSEVDRLLMASAITLEQADAARRWFADWYNSGVGGHGASWRAWRGGVAVSTVEGMNARQEASWRLYRACLESIPIWARGTTVACVIDDLSVKNLVALRCGLDVLVGSYGNQIR